MTYVDPYLAGKAELATARSQARTAEITAKANAQAAVITARAAAEGQRRAEKKQHAEARRQRWTRIGQRVAQSWHELLWVPVIVAPAVLAWSGQTAAGNSIWGGKIGWLLALFTECSAWVVEFYITASQRKNPTLASGRGRAAVWLVAAAAAAMNYLHGAATGPWWHGVVMAVVSIGGIALHQVAYGLGIAPSTVPACPPPRCGRCCCGGCCTRSCRCAPGRSRPLGASRPPRRSRCCGWTTGARPPSAGGSGAWRGRLAGASPIWSRRRRGRRRRGCTRTAGWSFATPKGR
jgi:hypothetical protein